jgi:hypothetical protein
MVKRNGDGKSFITEPIAYYRGDYTSNEGNIIISMNMRDNNKWLIIPITDLLIVPDKESVEIEQKDKKGKTEKVTIKDLPRARDIVQFNENEVLLYIESLANIGGNGNEFYMPVLRAKDGRVVNLALPTYNSLREVVIEDYLLDQSDEFVKLAKKHISLNPNANYQNRVGDNSKSVDVPQSNT